MDGTNLTDGERSSDAPDAPAAEEAPSGGDPGEAPWVPPAIERLGSVAELTRGGTGNPADNPVMGGSSA